MQYYNKQIRQKLKLEEAQENQEETYNRQGNSFNHYFYFHKNKCFK